MVLLDFLSAVWNQILGQTVVGERRTLFGTSSRPFVGGLCNTKFVFEIESFQVWVRFSLCLVESASWADYVVVV